MKNLALIIAVFCSLTVMAQDDQNIIKALNDSEAESHDEEDKIDRFDRWAYSKEEHAAFFYLAPMWQAGSGNDNTAHNIHHDAGVIYRWLMIDNDRYQLNLHGWVEQTSLWSGSYPKKFSEQLGMISIPSASDEQDHDVSLENLYVENFLMSGKLDLTFGKMDPLFLTSFTNYSGWDKYNYFSKSSASDPVPDIDGGMGFYTEIHASKSLSFGGMVTDGQQKNNFLYAPDFSSSLWNYFGFMRFKIGAGKGLYSDHNLIYYYQGGEGETPSGSGVLYTANQGLTDDLILILKFSNGKNRIDKLNAAYVAGLTFKNPLGRNGDQAGFSTMINSRAGQEEFGMDFYWRFFVNQYLNFAPNFQFYRTVNDEFNSVVGLRAFLTY
ncbi:hypothetical protein [Reichenbachiella sp.]|uniref:hypothetical protein n=1 Tax=Reichenbachiella sp. TaxID=2184521 RepID=UPI003B5B6B97